MLVVQPLMADGKSPTAIRKLRSITWAPAKGERR